MTTEDFGKILIASMRHQSKNSFFEHKRSIHHCLIDEFIEGLQDLFEELTDVINTDDIQDYFCGDKGSTTFLGFGTAIINNYDHTIHFQFEDNGKPVSFLFERQDLPILKKSIDEYTKYLNERGKFVLININIDKDNHKEEMLDCAELHKDMKPYLTGVSSFELSNIIKHHALSPGTPKAIWIGERVDACYFADYLQMRFSKWNKCFHFEDHKLLHPHSRDKLKMGSPILDLLKAHLPK